MRTGGGRAQTDQWLQNLKRHTNALVYHSFTARYCADVPRTQHTTWSTQSFFTHLLNQSQTTEHTHTHMRTHTRAHTVLSMPTHIRMEIENWIWQSFSEHTHIRRVKSVCGQWQACCSTLGWCERKGECSKIQWKLTSLPIVSLSKTQLPQEAYLSIHLSISIQILMKYMVIEEIWQAKQAKESWLLSFSCTAPNAKQSALSACTCLYWMANSKSYVSYWWRGLFTILLDCC